MGTHLSHKISNLILRRIGNVLMEIKRMCKNGNLVSFNKQIKKWINVR